MTEFAPGEGLPGQVWMQGASAWVEDIRDDVRFSTRDGAKTDGLITCWGVPVRVGNQVFAVIEFFSRKRMAAEVEITFDCHLDLLDRDLHGGGHHLACQLRACCQRTKQEVAGTGRSAGPANPGVRLRLIHGTPQVDRA